MRFACPAFSSAAGLLGLIGPFTLVALPALTGCSSPTPVLPDGAWVMNLSSAGGECDIMVNTTMVGDISDEDISQRITTGVADAMVTCDVVGTSPGPFNVDAFLSQNGNSLQINIGALTSSATKAAPVAGSVSYESAATAEPFSSSDCNFYFAKPVETVAPGKVWVAFTCAGIGDASTGVMCPVTESYALFENCGTTAGD